MATANVKSLATNGTEGSTRTRRVATAHLKLVPPDRETREQIREQVRTQMSSVDRGIPLSKKQLEQLSRSILGQRQLGEGYVGWTMVCLASEFWRTQVSELPPNRRLLLLPGRLAHGGDCVKNRDLVQNGDVSCAACGIERITQIAERMGYRVLPADGAAKVTRLLVDDEVDAVVGVACLDILEHAIDKVLAAGVACMAMPLVQHASGLQIVDADWICEMMEAVSPATRPPRRTRTYLHLMRAARSMFDSDEIQTLAPRSHARARLAAGTSHGDSIVDELDPIAATESVAFDFLVKGGKYSRPFITLAVYDALKGGQGTLAGGVKYLQNLPSAVKRAAIAIETFHKASLVHDDIEDDDQFRYGRPTLHRQLGIPAAINVGDYLIGMGYRLVARDQQELGPQVTASVLGAFAEAHHELSEGQGAELFWRDARDKRLSLQNALSIYKLKTAPAFEAALVVGATLANEDDNYRELFREFAHCIGIGFQVLNDLKDWRGDDDNKLGVGADVLGGRPTLLLALALENLAECEQDKLLDAINNSQLTDQVRLQRVRDLYTQANVFELAQKVVEQHRRQAEMLAEQSSPGELRRLLYYLIDSVLEQVG